MISNKSPYWLTVCADLEQEDPLFVRSHISAEFLEATCTEPLFGYCDECNRVDPFCPHQTEQSSLTASSISPTGLQPWGAHIASREPCPTCGHAPWWSSLDYDIEDDDDFDDCIDPQTGFAQGYKRYG